MSVAPEFVIGAYHQLFQTEQSLPSAISPRQHLTKGEA